MQAVYLEVRTAWHGGFQKSTVGKLIDLFIRTVFLGMTHVKICTFAIFFVCQKVFSFLPVMLSISPTLTLSLSLPILDQIRILCLDRTHESFKVT